MSLIWADNFQSYGSTVARMLDGIYAAADGTLVEDPDPSETSEVYFMTSLKILRYALPAGATVSGGMAARFWLNSLPNSGDPEFMSFRDAANAAQLTITMDTTGNLLVFRGSDSGTLLGQTTVPVIVASAWNHVEVKVLISDTVGTVEIRVNGVVKLALTGQDTKNTANANYAQIQWGSDSVASVQDHIKDLVVWDTAGTVNNDFFGQVKAVSTRPTADVSFNWTPSTGITGFNLVDEASPNDADYISAADPPPAASSFTLADLPADVTTVKGVITVARMRKTDGGDCNIQMAMLSGGDTDLGADRPITSAFTYYYDVSELDPDTVLPWTPTGYNAATLQINRTL